QPYVAHAYPAGTAVVLAGTPTVDRYGLQLTSPVIERDSEVNLHAGRLVPIYALTAGVTQKQLRFLVSLALPAAGQMTDPLSDTIRVREKLLSRADAIRSVHFPADDAERAAAQERLLFDDIVRYILRVRASREEMEEACAPRIIVNAAMVERVKGALPFVLTGAQERAVGEILGDMNASTPPHPPSQRKGGDLGGKPMQRLLNGDVGSGKTAVAAMAAAVVADAGRQVAYLAPTEVLTVQQAAVLTRWLQPLGIAVACWTRTTRRIDGTPVTLAVLRAAVRSGVVRIVVGTHAILADAVQFSDLALAIIDEQHRFGVEQRAALRKKARVSDDGVACMPHLLSMTATPIPRTLQLSLLGDLAVSVLDERPQARRPVATSVIV
ncbi:MAG: DEAD/DEAH box helicase, partial [bacterium]|nr:DEAD/DEAH box helicase [bacterium]